MRNTIGPGSEGLSEKASNIRHDAHDADQANSHSDNSAQEKHQLEQSLSLEDARKRLETRDTQESVQNSLESLKPDIHISQTDTESVDDFRSSIGARSNGSNISPVVDLYPSASEGRRIASDSVRSKVRHMQQFFGIQKKAS